MGKVIVDVKLSNFKGPSKSIQTQALVDTGATMLVLPEDIVEKIGLEELYETIVSYADGSKKKKKVDKPPLAKNVVNRLLPEGFRINRD